MREYVFTLGRNGETVVKEFEPYDDSIDYATIIKNVAIGKGVILLCVTVTIVGAAVGAPAICMIFAYAADTAIAAAESGAIFGAISAGITTYNQNGDFDASLRSALVGASDGYKWGAISGAIVGGGTETAWLKIATRNGLTLNEAAIIQVAAPELPLSVIRNLHSVDEYAIYQTAGLSLEKLSTGKYAMVRNINWSFVDEQGRTNAVRVAKYHLSPLDENGVAYELHHIGQQPNSPLAILTKAEHMQGGNNKILHWRDDSCVSHGTEWQDQVHQFWMTLLNASGGV